MDQPIIHSPSPHPTGKEQDSDTVIGTPLNLESTKVKSFQSPPDFEEERAILPPILSERGEKRHDKSKKIDKRHINKGEKGEKGEKGKKGEKEETPFSSIDVIEGKEKSEKSPAAKNHSLTHQNDELRSSLVPKRFTETYEASIISFKSFRSKPGTSFKTEDENNAKHNPVSSPQHSLHSLHSLHSQGSREAVSSSNCHLSGTGAGNSKLASR